VATDENRFMRVPETGSCSSSDLMWDWPFRPEEEDYKLWPANKSDRSWQSLSNPAKRHSFVSN